MGSCNPPPPEIDGDDWQRNTIDASGNNIIFDAGAYCVIHLRPNSGVVQMMSNIADARCASMYAAQVENDGGHVFASVPAGVLLAALKQFMEENYDINPRSLDATAD